MVPGQVGVPGESAVRAVEKKLGGQGVGGQELASVPLQKMEANRVMGQQMRKKPASKNLAQVKQIWWSWCLCCYKGRLPKINKQPPLN